MKSIIRISALLFSSLVFITTAASATSWAKLQPEDITARAAVVVQGTYQIPFGSKGNGEDGVFTAYNFKVAKYYKGSGETLIQAGVNGFDVGWVKEHQAKGGTFLLFLQPGTQFLTPVGGPNGMVRLENGNIQGQSEADQLQFEQFLAKQEVSTPAQSASRQIGTWRWAALGAAAMVIAITAIWWKQRSKKNQAG